MNSIGSADIVYTVRPSCRRFRSCPKPRSSTSILTVPQSTEADLEFSEPMFGSLFIRQSSWATIWGGMRSEFRWSLLE